MPISSKLVGASSALREIERDIEAVAHSDAKVLITGESGVGKDIVARCIHEHGWRREGPFVTINCAGVPDSLLESELFGHVRGSFTGAYRDKRGWLEQARGGTIFLDEIGEMTPRMQSLLLRFLENGEIQPVGADRIRPASNVRVITATNRNLVECVAQQQFREDLYYRVNVIHIRIPPLRDRPDDIAPLIAHFLEAFSAEYSVACPILAEETRAMLTAYAWPGNVRELRNLIERLVVRNSAGLISVFDLPPAISGVAQARKQTADALYERMVQAGESFWTVVHGPFLAHDVTRDDLRALVARGLMETRGSYRGLVPLFNLSANDYRRFTEFLKRHDCRLPPVRFRIAPPTPASVRRPPDPSSPFSARNW
jgi:transcriptional regulator with PAS, ATPase and Fis domain